ncbi:MAG: hypothetical protein AB1426_12060 [Bacillota bacterium]
METRVHNSGNPAVAVSRKLDTDPDDRLLYFGVFVGPFFLGLVKEQAVTVSPV